MSTRSSKEQDEELIANFIRIRHAKGHTLMEVAVVKWPSPSEPKLLWHSYHDWSSPPTEIEVFQMQEQILNDPQYFELCQRCGERCNTGHMHNSDFCQGCATEYLGVIY